MFTPEQRARAFCWHIGAVLIDGSTQAWITGRNVGAEVELRRVGANELEKVHVDRLERENPYSVSPEERHANIAY